MTDVDRPEKYPLTVIVLTYNEEQTIESCLKWLEWVDDVVLVDSHSVDETLVRARAVRSDVRIFEHPFRDFGDQRNWALTQTQPKHPWVLFLDADEHCTDECQRGIRSALESPGEHVGFYMTCRNFFLGKWIKRCTLYPSWQLRLLKLGAVEYRKEGHGQREVTDGPLGYVSQPYDHYGFSHGIDHWIARHNKYSTNEVELIQKMQSAPLEFGDLLKRDPIARRRCLKRLAAKVGFRPLTRFLYLYFGRFGFLDGRAGLTFCLLRMAHEIHITAKLAEHRHAVAVQNLKGVPPAA